MELEHSLYMNFHTRFFIQSLNKFHDVLEDESDYMRVVRCCWVPVQRLQPRQW
jgi:hypothetical protein